MESLYLLIPLSIGIVFVAIWVFFGASDSGQFDDLVGPGLRILHDDDGGVQADPTPPEQGSRPPGDAHSLRVPEQR
jgi:cbb3-type cytochrome oxidase maturation protein